MENVVSYRQVGREKGHVPPPRLKDEGKHRRTGSERDAFGNRTERFGTRSYGPNDVPPPGAYYRPSTLERDGRVCGSVSAKGYCSGFVSAAPRFRDVKILQQAHLPGPGSYNAQPEVGSEGAKMASFSSLRRDCGFTPDPLNSAPGPGEYDVDRKSRQQMRPGPTSSFRCKRALVAVGTNLETPAPGTYELLQNQYAKIDKNGQVLKDPCFRSQTKRDASFITASEVPGPGEYDVGRTIAASKEPFGSGGSGAKSPRANLRRSGGHSKDDDDISPGPGWYTPQQTNQALRSSSSSSMFRSGTKRFAGAMVPVAPGPAFYQPEPLGRKSFRWNANKQWV